MRCGHGTSVGGRSDKAKLIPLIAFGAHARGSRCGTIMLTLPYSSQACVWILSLVSLFSLIRHRGTLQAGGCIHKGLCSTLIACARHRCHRRRWRLRSDDSASASSCDASAWIVSNQRGRSMRQRRLAGGRSRSMLSAAATAAAAAAGTVVASQY